ncbi:hypothetical protein ACFQL0_19835 [Haloplanus litoreus]|uniref:hypothetical protein n=1 Tax=Haloplanus litoreus TaxID=767515 RepID=UPI00360B4359
MTDTRGDDSDGGEEQRERPVTNRHIPPEELACPFANAVTDGPCDEGCSDERAEPPIMMKSIVWMSPAKSRGDHVTHHSAKTSGDHAVHERACVRTKNVATGCSLIRLRIVETILR